MTEKWRWVPGFEGQYQVSNRGRVKSYRRGGVRLLRPGLMTIGYYSVALGRGNTRTLHALVAEAFIGPRPPGMDVRHLDGTRTNNRVENLTYGTRTENILDGTRHNRRKLSVETVARIRQDAERMTGAAIARKYDASTSHISAILNRKVRIHA